LAVKKNEMRFQKSNISFSIWFGVLRDQKKTKLNACASKWLTVPVLYSKKIAKKHIAFLLGRSSQTLAQYKTKKLA